MVGQPLMMRMPLVPKMLERVPETRTPATSGVL